MSRHETTGICQLIKALTSALCEMGEGSVLTPRLITAQIHVRECFEFSVILQSPRGTYDGNQQKELVENGKIAKKFGGSSFWGYISSPEKQVMDNGLAPEAKLMALITFLSI